MRPLRIVAATFLLSLLLACGSDAPAPGSINVTVTPAAISISAGSTLELRGDATGFTRTPLVGWWMEEARGSPTALYCGLDYGAPTPSSTDCPCGYVLYNTTKDGVPATATYHAPDNARVCHPIFQATQWDGYMLQVSKTGRAEITVTP